MIKTDKATAIKMLQNQISILQSFEPSELNLQKVKSWQHDTEHVLENIFGIGSHQLNTFAKIKYRPAISLLSSSKNDQSPLQIQCLKNGFDEARTALHSFLKEIEEFWRDGNPDSSSVGFNEVVEIHPNIFGLGLNINALIKKYFHKR